MAISLVKRRNKKWAICSNGKEGNWWFSLGTYDFSFGVSASRESRSGGEHVVVEVMREKYIVH